MCTESWQFEGKSAGINKKWARTCYPLKKGNGQQVVEIVWTCLNKEFQHPHIHSCMLHQNWRPIEEARIRRLTHLVSIAETASQSLNPDSGQQAPQWPGWNWAAFSKTNGLGLGIATMAIGNIVILRLKLFSACLCPGKHLPSAGPHFSRPQP